jgi:cell division septal protein FtsQ
MSWLKKNPQNRLIKPAVSSPKMVLFKQALVGVVITLVLVALGYGVWYGTRIERLTINEVQVVGGETVSEDQIINLVEQKLQGNYFHIVPRRFAWSYPEVEILNELKSIDRIKNVHLERDGTKLLVAFEEYRPVALWCKNIHSKDCLFLDNAGFAFATAPYLEGSAFLRYSEVNREPTIKTEAFPAQFIEAVNLFVDNAYNTLGLNIIHVEKTSADDVEYLVSQGGVIKVSTIMSTRDTLENLEAILKSPEFEHIEPGNFKYIDLRFGNKVFVNEVTTEETTSTSTTDLTLIPEPEVE